MSSRYSRTKPGTDPAVQSEVEVRFSMLLSLIEEVELASCDFYVRCARGGHLTDVIGLFERLAAEEKGHAVLAGMLKRVSMGNEDGLKQVNQGVDALELVNERLRSLMPMAERLATKDAIQAALALENSLAEGMRQVALTHLNESFARFMARIVQQEEAHIALLEMQSTEDGQQ